MSEMCTDNRFELIEKYKAKLIEATNIETSKDEMAVIDNVLFRFWQMGWLDRLEMPVSQPERKKGEWIRDKKTEKEEQLMFHKVWTCSECGKQQCRPKPSNFCPNCGADMRGE